MIQFLKTTIICALILMFSGCLKTRSEVSPNEQNYIARKKLNENQKNESETTKLNAQQSVAQDELIRTLNGRIEVLENQVVQMKSEQALSQNSADAQKITALQEALTKMELQIQKLESGAKSSDTEKESLSVDKNSSSDDQLNLKKSDYDLAENLFAQKEWKKAILSYQKFVDKFPKSKLVPDSKYKTGVCFQELEMLEEAKAFYEETLVQYPQTLAGKKSKIRLGNLAASSKSKKK